MAKFKVAIVGSGPGGLGAACHAAELDVSHVLLESAPHLSNTVYLYQKGKHVMAEPGVLPLRSPVPFQAGKREEVLHGWAKSAQDLSANLKLSTEVKSITGQKGAFKLELTKGEAVEAEAVVLGIGMQGNLRKMGVPGDDLPMVQYQLDDPDEYHGETILVIGAGDAAIENAIALSNQNQVIIVNRKDEFSRAKDGNNQAILAAIESDKVNLDCLYKTTPDNVVEIGDESKHAAAITLNTAEGTTRIECDRIIARLGAIPPRKFVESCGVQFSSDDPTAIPAVSGTYESNVPGLYIVGALAGYPLIKQALNQGYEVIEYILGNDVEPADTPLLREKFKVVPDRSVDSMLDFIKNRLRYLRSLTALQFREFILDSVLHAPLPGEVIFERNDYTNTVFSVLEGQVYIDVNPEDPTSLVTLGRSEFFGEMGLISGRRRTATVTAGENCLLVETPRRSMLKLIASVPQVQRAIDETFLMRAIQANIAPGVEAEKLKELVETAEVMKFRPGDVLFNEGEDGDCLYLIRSGSVTVSRIIDGKDVVLAYVPAGQYVGEMALISDAPRSATVRAAVAADVIKLDGKMFMDLLAREEFVRNKVQQVYETRLAKEMAMAAHPEAGGIISFLMQQGLGEATDVLLIDESLCIRCDFCERACAATHGNVSRLDREAGPTFANVHVPTSCRHCEHPHCMKDCPSDAIHRTPNGEVFIDDKCIGCGNCEKNCPYGVIQMGIESPKSPSLVSWLLTGAGPEPGDEFKVTDKDKAKRAVKCDMCVDLKGGPACVRACPTGAAVRVSPQDFIERVQSD